MELENGRTDGALAKAGRRKSGNDVIEARIGFALVEDSMVSCNQLQVKTKSHLVALRAHLQCQDFCDHRA